MVTKLRMVTFILILALILPAGVIATATAEREQIKVGVPATVTGKYDVFGKRNLWGAKLWAEWVNDTGGIFVADLGKRLPVKISSYDTKSDKDTTIKLTEKLIVEDKVDFLFAPYGSSLTFAASAVTERYGKLLISHSGASDKLWQQGYKYLVGVLTPSSRYYKSTVNMLTALEPKVKTVALITQDNPFTLSMLEGLRKWVEQAGFEIVLDEVYPETPVDLSPLLRKVKESSPDAILASSHFKDGALLAKQTAELGVYTKFFALGSAPSTTEWWKTLGEVANYQVSTSQWEPVNAPNFYKFENWYGPRITAAEYNQWFKERWGETTDFRGAQIFQAGLALQWAIEQAGSLKTDKVREALNDIDIMTFYGACKIAPSGIQTAHAMTVAQWQDGELVVVWPPEIAEADLVYPIPE